MTFDIEKHIEYWSTSAKEDLDTAELLLDSKKVRHGLFFAHLSLEKAFKAHFCKETQNLAPRIHNLLRLTEKISLDLTDQQKEFLAKFDRYQLEGRYPELWPQKVNLNYAYNELYQAKELFKWLIDQL